MASLAGGVAAPVAATDPQTEEALGGSATLNIAKSAEEDRIAAGDLAAFTISVWNTGPGDALGVILSDELPAGVNWGVEVRDADADDSCALSGTEAGDLAFSCEFGTLPTSDMAGAKVVLVTGDTDHDGCGTLENTAIVEGTNSEGPVQASASIIVDCPALTIAKAADTDMVTIDGSSASPAVITWTLSYTLSNGGVTTALISDALPVGLDYVDGSASNGGAFDESTRTVAWAFPSLQQSGVVTFQTSADAATISRSNPTVNVAVISSDQTPVQEARAELRVTVEPPPLGSTSRPSPAPQASTPPVPDTAMIAPDVAPDRP